MAQEATTPEKKRSELREKLVRHFNRDELRTLCFDLGIDSENLPEAKEPLVRDLVLYCERQQSTPELIRDCREKRPNVSWPDLLRPGSQLRLFICYKRHVDPDQKLATYLYKSLTDQGHDVFIDTTMRAGESWLEEIDQRIKASDFLIVLLSRSSADSEMVKSEVRRACDYRRSDGHPNILPVRVAYEDRLPYSIDAFLGPLQYVVWNAEADNERLGRDVQAAMEGCWPNHPSIQAKDAISGLTVSEDGRVVADDDALHAPLPEFDPRCLDDLEAPGGAVKLRDKFYIERGADARLRREVVRTGSTVTIRAARQTGKSSLLVRGIHHAREHGAKVVSIDVQRVDKEYLESYDRFLRKLAEAIVRGLRLDASKVENAWSSSHGPQDKLTYFMEDYILPEGGAPILLAMDEVDRLLQTSFYSDFFGMLRSWHNLRADNELWNVLNIVMVISTEPQLLITGMQSPFNVGLRLYLEDFTETQVRELNERHGSPVEASDLPRFMDLLSGHPYLVRKALYTLVTERLTLTDLMRVAATSQGPFGDHLRHLQWLLRDDPDLRETLKQIIHQGSCSDDQEFFRLLRAGLVKGSGQVCKCRCDLYKTYFHEIL